MIRVGHGVDVHPFAPDRALVLAGVSIPSPRGLAGHSDADVVLHALCDALLGAAGMQDIGHWFPSSDEQYRSIRSTVLLDRVVAMIREKGWVVVNADISILAQEPKLQPYFEAMRVVLSTHLGIAPDAVGIKATTTESLGFVGRGEGVEAHAVCLLSAG